MPLYQDRRDFLRTALGGLGYATLAGCGGGSSSSDSLAPPADAEQLIEVPASGLAAMRARPETFLDVYGALASGSSTSADVVRAKLGAQFASLDDAGCMAVYATMVAFDCAPQGTTSLAPLTATLAQLMNSDFMACGHFCKLTTLLTALGHPQVIPPDAAAGSPAKPTVHFLVWVQSVPLDTGIHSQLILANVLDDAYLLLDPTYGYGVRIPYVGAGPDPSLTVIENAATMLQTPIAADNLVVLNPETTLPSPQTLEVVLGGQLSPGYIYHDSIYGSEGWDTRIAGIFSSLV